jgi:hypothetical protein
MQRKIARDHVTMKLIGRLMRAGERAARVGGFFVEPSEIGVDIAVCLRRHGRKTKSKMVNET